MTKHKHSFYLHSRVTYKYGHTIIFDRWSFKCTECEVVLFYDTDDEEVLISRTLSPNSIVGYDKVDESIYEL